MSDTKGPYITKADIEAFLAMEEERKSYARLADALKAKAAPLREKLWAFVLANGGEEQSCRRSGFVLAINTVAGTVAWGKAYVELAGEEAAERLRALCPRREVLNVERIG